MDITFEYAANLQHKVKVLTAKVRSYKSGKVYVRLRKLLETVQKEKDRTRNVRNARNAGTSGTPERPERPERLERPELPEPFRRAELLPKAHIIPGYV